MNKKIILLASLMAIPSVYAQDANEEKEYQDMSDPMAVYTQAGFGFTNKGVNLKFGQVYDTGEDNTAGMNIVELKGIFGERLGWDGNSSRDDSIDSLRYRNFEVDLETGLGAQIDIDYHFEGNHMADEWGSISYSLMQALPKWGKVQLFPLAGVGLNVGNNVIASQAGLEGKLDAGYGLPGSFAVVGMYSKVDITDKIWMNYNPMYTTVLSGSTFYKENAFGMDNDDILLHELSLSYKINKRSNVRYYANWSDEVNFGDGDHRIEYNYQF